MNQKIELVSTHPFNQYIEYQLCVRLCAVLSIKTIVMNMWSGRQVNKSTLTAHVIKALLREAKGIMGAWKTCT